MMLKVLLALTFIAAVSAEDHDHDGDGVADHAGKGKGKKVAEAGGSLTATLGDYPGIYNLIYGITGTVTATFGTGGVITFGYDMAGLEVSVGGGIHIHTGTSCDDATTVGGHYFSPDLGEDPWTTQYTSDGEGAATSSAAISTGYGYAANLGHAVVVHAADGSRVACGVLAETDAEMKDMGTMVMDMGEADMGEADMGEAKVTDVEHDHDGDGVADHMAKGAKKVKGTAAKVAKVKANKVAKVKAPKADKVAKVKVAKVKGTGKGKGKAGAMTAIVLGVTNNKSAFVGLASAGVLAVAAAVFITKQSKKVFGEAGETDYLMPTVEVVA